MTAGARTALVGRLDTAFAAARDQHRPALITYVMGGDPDIEASRAIIVACIDGGADIVEIGMPFSDPIADGPVIQRAAERALAAGTRVRDVIALAAAVRRDHQTPIALMGYLNPILAMGEEAFVRACAAAGVDALIVPDMLPEEGGDFRSHAAGAGVGTVFLVASTSTPERAAAAAAASTAFVYLVSVSGVTGARSVLPEGLGVRLAAIQAVSEVPVVVGFGISTREQVRALAPVADGIVVGSAIVAAAARTPGLTAAAEVRALVRSLRQALEAGQS